MPGNQYDTVLIRYDPIMFEVCHMYHLPLCQVIHGPLHRFIESVQNHFVEFELLKRAWGFAHRQGSCWHKGKELQQKMRPIWDLLPTSSSF